MRSNIRNALHLCPITHVVPQQSNMKVSYLSLALSIALVALVSITTVSAYNSQVKTNYGVLQGTTANNGAQKWVGVPFAAPPGKLNCSDTSPCFTFFFSLSLSLSLALSPSFSHLLLFSSFVLFLTSLLFFFSSLSFSPSSCFFLHDQSEIFVSAPLNLPSPGAEFARLTSTARTVSRMDTHTALVLS